MKLFDRTQTLLPKQNPVEHRAWHNMKRRCYTESAHGYDRVGGLGIRVCDEWREDFAAFLRDVGKRPDQSSRLCRKDLMGHFTPNNVYWGTQSLSTSTSKRRTGKRNKPQLTARGETLSLVEWSRRTGINDSTIRARLRYGWTPDEVLGFVPRKPAAHDWHTARSYLYEYNGERKTGRQWAAEYGLHVKTFRNRINQGWTMERALTEPVGKQGCWARKEKD